MVGPYMLCIAKQLCQFFSLLHMAGNTHYFHYPLNVHGVSINTKLKTNIVKFLGSGILDILCKSKKCFVQGKHM